MKLYFLIASTSAFLCSAFNLQSNVVTRRTKQSLEMKWTFGKGAGSLQDLGAIGSEGEYYFHPNKAPAKLKGPPEAFTQKSRVIPIFPYTNVLVPLGSDWLNILEMRHRQLLGDVGDGLFGFCYYSQTQQKLGLVGTLARIKGTLLSQEFVSQLSTSTLTLPYLRYHYR
jgi:hypothetical protein